MKYRSDIDGLRCLAVSSVFLFHLNEHLLPGGFAGVDIFFVISGFLISRIIVSEIDSGAFSVTRFYARRIRRIFPALFVMLLACALMAVVALPPKLYSLFFTEFHYAILQISNFLFVQGRGYFEPTSDYSVLLHTWSLGVEEQFYLIWPFLLLAVARFAQGRFLTVLGLVTTLSFFLSDYLCSSSPQAAFFMLPSRAWELGIGGMTAILARREIRSAALTHLLASAGLLLVVIPLMTLHSSEPFPGRNALPVVPGTALLLYSGASPFPTPAIRLFSLAPFAAVGLISYSLYLWHWPLIVFHRAAVGGEINLFSGTIIVLVAIACALASYTLVERPCRQGDILAVWNRLFSRLSSYARGYRALTFLFLLLILPLCALQLLRLSTGAEENSSVTTVTMDVSVIASKRPLTEEVISLYWGDRRGNYSEQNVKHLRYSPKYLNADHTYRFSFTIPDLSHAQGLRLDPLRGEGEVRIANIVVTTGLLQLAEPFDARELLGGDRQKTSNNLTIQVDGENIATHTSRGDDPYCLLFPDTHSNTAELLILFAALSGIGMLFLTSSRLARRGQRDAIAVSAGAIAIVATLLFSSRLAYSNHSTWRFLASETAKHSYTSAPLTRTSEIEQAKNPDILLIGDSHAANFADLVHDWAQHHELELKITASPACPPIFLHPPRQGETPLLSDIYQMCTQNNNKVLTKAINNPKTQFIFLALRQEFYLESPRVMFSRKARSLLPDDNSFHQIVEDSLRETVQTLVDAGKTVVLLGQIPILRESPETCLAREAVLLSAILNTTSDCDIEETFRNAKLSPGNDLLLKVAEISPQVHYFDPTRHIPSIFAPPQRLFYDDNHLNHLGSLDLSHRMEHDLDTILPHDQGGHNMLSSDHRPQEQEFRL